MLPSILSREIVDMFVSIGTPLTTTHVNVSLFKKLIKYMDMQ